jgi:methyl-accepting chemotaxis protein
MSGRLVTTLFDRYAPTISDARDRALWTAARSDWQSYVKASAGVTTASRANRDETALAILNGQARDIFQRLDDRLATWSNYNRGLASADATSAHSTFTSARTLLILLAAIAALISLAVAVLLSRSIIRAVRAARDRLEQLRREDIAALRGAMTAMADGNLAVRVEPVTPAIDRWPNDELGDVAQAVNGVRADTAASMTRVAADDTATAAGEARRVATEGAEAAEKATGAMTQVRASSTRVTEAIRTLSGKSEEIGGIVETIGALIEQITAAVWT